MGNIPGNEDGEFPAFPAVPVRRKERGTKSTKILLKKLLPLQVVKQHVMKKINFKKLRSLKMELLYK